MTGLAAFGAEQKPSGVGVVCPLDHGKRTCGVAKYVTGFDETTIEWPLPLFDALTHDNVLYHVQYQYLIARSSEFERVSPLMRGP
jgi:hypothetical protein